jgi:hypothetical protein
VTQATEVPGPLRVLVARADAEPEPFKRTWRLIDTFEWAIKWAATLALTDVLQRAGVSSRLKLSLARGLRTPSLGLWLSFYRAALEEPPASTRPWADWDRLLALDDQHRLVAFRNEYAHGAVHTDEQSAAHFATYRPVLDELLAAPIYTATRLVVPTGDGERVVDRDVVRVGEDVELRPALVRVDGSDTPLELWPLGVFAPPDRHGSSDREPGPRVNGRLAFYYFNALRNERVERLNYELPDRVRDPSLWDAFTARLPLEQWRRDASVDPDPFARRVDELTATFTGRDDERAQVASFVEQGRGTLFVWGPPGIGKSALLAMVVREVRAGADDRVVLLDYFIRRGSQEDAPGQLLSSLIRRIDAIYGLPRQPTGATLEELFEAFGRRLRDVERGDDPRPLVLLVDGLDENPELCRFLPHSSERVRVICGSRPVQAVLDVADRRSGPVENLHLGPLGDAEVRALLYGVVDKYRDEVMHGGFVRTLHRRSEGNPLFVSLVCNELFVEPDRIEHEEAIPSQLEGAFRDAVDRATDQGRDATAGEVLLLFAAARETIGPSAAAALLDASSMAVRPAVERCRELLFREVTDDEPRYGLFHDALRTWLRRRHRLDLRRLDQRIGRAALSSPDVDDPARGYLHRHGLRHLLDVWQRVADDDVTGRLQELWCDQRRVQAKLDDQGPLDLFADADRCFALLPDEPMAGSLAELVAGDAVRREPQLTPEVLHALLVYRPTTELFSAMLVHLTDADFLADAGVDDPELHRWLLASYRYCLGSVHRKRGGPHDLAIAQRLLTEASGPLEEAAATGDPAATRVLAKASYERGYVDFLRGDVVAALPAIDASARLSEQGDDATGVAISRVVADRLRYLHGRLPGHRWADTMATALTRFVEDAPTSPRADRWVMQVYVHQIELAFLEGDAATAQSVLELLEDHPWIDQFARRRSLTLARGRVAATGGRHEEACRRYVEALGPSLDADPGTQHTEALARDLVDLALSLRACGREREAHDVLRHALALPPDAGNRLGQRAARELLDE